MKYQSFFSEINEKNITDLSSAENSYKVVKVKSCEIFAIMPSINFVAGHIRIVI